jgi:GMP synthase-like glutamine amidotransferase
MAWRTCLDGPEQRLGAVGSAKGPPGAPVACHNRDMPACLIVQHVEPEKPFAIASALEGVGAEIDIRRTHAGQAVPASAAGYDAVVVMGGPMSALSDDGFPTRRAEIVLLADALEREVPVLGVCLGAQLLAAAAGGRVVRGDAGQEIGWGGITLTEEATGDPLFAGMPSPMTVLHWHGETFELPASAVHLASSSVYRNQAFRTGPCAWGLQFHLEVDGSAVGEFVSAFGEEASALGVDPREVVTATPQVLAGLADLRDEFLGRFAQLTCCVPVSADSGCGVFPDR